MMGVLESKKWVEWLGLLTTIHGDQPRAGGMFLPEGPSLNGAGLLKVPQSQRSWSIEEAGVLRWLEY